MDIEFRDLTFSSNRRIFGKKKTILKGINGQFRAGELTAIMGCSGAGKTTLIKILSGYRLGGITGHLGVNGTFPRNERILRKYSCYIRQEEIHQHFLTVDELLELVAQLKLPPSTTKEERQKLINNILKDFNITNDTSMIVDDLTHGQRKRLSIALELINNPNIFFLDEPTSGLDIVVAKQCVKTMWELAHSGNRTVVCTLHTPSASMFQQLDLVYLLSDGKCIYQGAPSQLVSYMASMSLHCPIHYNPADYVIEVVERSEETQEMMMKAIDNGRNTCRAPDKISVLFNDSVVECEEKYEMENRQRLLTSNWTQFRLLFKRMLIQHYRDKIAIRLQLIHHLVSALIFCLLFARKANDGGAAIFQMKFCISLVVNLSFTWVMVPILLLPYEISLLRKEHFNRWYNLIPFYFAYNMIKLPLLVFLNCLFLVPTYIIFGLPLEMDRMFLFLFTAILVAVISDSIGLIIGSFLNITYGSMLGSSVMTPFLLVAGYGFDFPHLIPDIVHFLMKLTFMRTGNIALMIIMYRDRPRMDCPDDAFCFLDDPNVILRFMGVDKDPVFPLIGIMLINVIIFRFIAILGLKYKLRMK